MWLLFESIDESACSPQSHVVVIDPKEQNQTVSGRPLVRTHQRRMLVRGPLVKAEQDGSIRVQDLAPVFMAGCGFGLSEK